MSPRPKKFLRETDHYWVIGEEPSDSGDKVYEIRTSKRDGRTYCSHPTWYQTLQPWWVAKGHKLGVCKHMQRFFDRQKLKPPEEVEEVTTYDLDSWAAAKRVGLTDKVKAMPDELKVRRPGC